MKIYFVVKRSDFLSLKRTRNNRIEIRLSDDEFQIMREKFKQSNMKNISNFIRKCVFEKHIFVIDMTPFYKIQYLLSNESNNINQITKHVNTTNKVYKSDIENIKKTLNETSHQINKMYQLFVKHSVK